MKLVRKWKSSIECPQCEHACVVEEYQRTPFIYHVRCPKCKLIEKTKDLPASEEHKRRKDDV